MSVHQAEILYHIKLADYHTASTAEIWHLDHHHIWKSLVAETKISLLSVLHLPRQHPASHCTLWVHSVPSGGTVTVQSVPEYSFQQISKTKQLKIAEFTPVHNPQWLFIFSKIRYISMQYFQLFHYPKCGIMSNALSPGDSLKDDTEHTRITASASM